MKTPKKREFASNYSSDFDFQEFMNLYKKCTEKPPFWLLILLFHPIILYVTERISQKEYKTNHDN